MKRKIILLITAIIYAATAFATDTADSAYSQKRYQDAIRIYEAQAKAEGTSSDLYYNLGCAHYKMQNVPYAILCFERALILNSSNTDAKANLQFVREKAKIADNAPEGFLSDLMQQSVGQLSSDSWAIIAAIVFVVLLLAIAAYIFLDSVLWRKVGFFGAGFLLVALICTMGFAFYQRSVTMGHSSAIVMPQSATLSTAPHSPSEKEVAYKLNGGIKVGIVDSVSTASKSAVKWYKVEVAGHEPAWISSADIEKI